MGKWAISVSFIWHPRNHFRPGHTMVPWGCIILGWLVVEPTPLKNMKVNWDDELPMSYGKIKVMFQSPPTSRGWHYKSSKNGRYCTAPNCFFWHLQLLDHPFSNKRASRSISTMQLGRTHEFADPIIRFDGLWVIQIPCSFPGANRFGSIFLIPKWPNGCIILAMHGYGTPIISNWFSKP